MVVRKSSAARSMSMFLHNAFICGFAISLIGCGVGASFPNTTSEGSALVLSGRVHGGQQPVTGSHIHVMQAASSAYGAASTPLMTANGTTILSDSIGPYVTTDSNGNFSITSDYTCTAGSQVYVLATQGNPGMASGTNNTGIGLMAGLGACPSTHSFSASVPYVFMDEITTVATAYALAGFFTDATHLATDGSAGATTGINNAAANITQISSLTTGQALATTPNGLGTVPQTTLNLLGNILAYCINSNGSNCSNLFSLAMNGSTAPTETATAAINIAHNPGANVTALYDLVNATGPFQNSLSPAPNDYSITVNYTPATPIFATQGTIAIDASGNVWGPGNNASSVVELSPLGAQTHSISFTPTSNGQYAALRVSVSPAGSIWVGNYGLFSAAPTATTFTAVTDSGAAWAGSELAAAFDTSNNVWSGNNYPASFGKLSASGSVYSTSDNGYAPVGFAPGTNPVTYPAEVFGVAVDSANHIWGICGKCVGNQVSGDAAEITSSGASVPTSADAPSSILYPSGLAIDSSNNAWISDFNTGFVTEYSSASVLLSGSGYPSGGGLGGLNSVAIDGSSNIFIAGGGGPNKNLNGVLYELNNSGVLTSPTGSFQAPSSVTFYYPNSIAVDGSGDVWTLDYNGGLHVTLGIAMPVVTPITPSALGARP